MNVHVNEWGVPELTAAQEAAIDEAALAGCPDVGCEGITLCDPCGQLVCVTHTHAVIDCAEGVGTHHEACVDGCSICVDLRAREQAVAS